MTPTDTELAEAQAAATGVAGSDAKRAYVRRIFSEIAPRYDLLNHLLSLNVDRRWRRAAVRALDIPRTPGGVYLDLCAGTLDLAAEIACDSSFSGRVVAADFAEPMLLAGRRKAAGLRVFPVVADALELPVATRSVDGVAVAFGIRNVVDPAACAREVARVLRPRARFVVLEFSTPRSPLMGALYRFYFHAVLPAVGGAVSGHPTAYRYLPQSVSVFPEGEAFVSLLAGAGFRSITRRPLTMGIATLYVGERA